MGSGSIPTQALRFSRHRGLPIILQTEATECGLACLAMIGRYYGHELDLPALRRRFSTSLKGATLARVMEMASVLKLRSRPVKLHLEEMSQLETPCILHWDLNHFVVLKSATNQRVTIHDPARGLCKLTLAEVSQHFTGIALELSPENDFQPVRDVQTISLRALAGDVRGLGQALMLIFTLALSLEAFALLGPFYLQWVLDQVLVSADRDLLALLGIGFLLVVLFRTLITAARAWAVTWLSTILSAQWISNLFAHLLRLPLDWYEKRHVGDVVSRFSSVRIIQETLTNSFVSTILDGLMASLTLIVLSLYSIELTFIVLLGFALYAGLRFGFYGPLRNAQEERIVYAARQQSELLESIRGAQTLKLQNEQAARAARFANALVETINRDNTVQRLSIGFSACNQLIFGVQRIVLIWLAARLILDGGLSAGMLVAFAAYADQFTTRAGSLIDKAIEFRMLRLHGERVADIALTSPEEHLESDYAGPLPKPQIELCNVSFRYSEGEPWILRNCSLLIEAGESVAIVGPSGCGKTTLAKLILGLLQPAEGTVLVGGHNIRRLGLMRYRSMLGTVMQEDRLFTGSIADNISGFDPDAMPLQIETAARLAAIHEEIAAMPMGYQTLVGDMGSGISGGQKQRLLLARALYRHPKLLVLDEATSHLDVERERQVNSAVQKQDMTRIVIAHRPETIASAQRVLMVVNGTVQTASQPPHEVEVAA